LFFTTPGSGSSRRGADPGGLCSAPDAPSWEDLATALLSVPLAANRGSHWLVQQTEKLIERNGGINHE
jgi:hypothetical protein